MRPFGYGHIGAFGGFGIFRLIFGGLFALAVLVILILLIVWLARMATHRGRSYAYALTQPVVGPPQSNALDILQARYAKGEITREEYQQMLADISKQSG
jgi:putative membrane protein